MRIRYLILKKRIGITIWSKEEIKIEADQGITNQFRDGFQTRAN